MMTPRIAIPPQLSARDFADRIRGDVATIRGQAMGTTWSVQYVPAVGPGPGIGISQVAARVAAILQTIVAELSQWETGSELSRFNRAPPGTWKVLTPALQTVLAAGLDLARLSDGAFDPAIGRLASGWGFGAAGPVDTLPDERMIANALAAGGWRSIEISGQFARRTADVALDFSGIGKGYAVDAVVDGLTGLGLRHFLVEIGGELRGVGIRPDAQPWWIDVELPPAAVIAPFRIALHGLAVATSGDYRRWFEHDGTRYAHSIDPRTGRPVANGVASVTVVHASCMMADAWATALTVLGPEAGIALADAHDIAAHLIIRGQDGHFPERLSAAMERMLG